MVVSENGLGQQFELGYNAFSKEIDALVESLEKTCSLFYFLIYSRTSMARTLMARLPRLFQARS